VRDDRGAAMQLGDGAEIDREGELDLLTLAKTEVRGLHEHAGRGEIDRPTSFFRPAGVVMYTVVRARCLVCNLRSTD
jgi:hypothetical protein